MAIRTRPFNPAEYLDTEESRVEYLISALESNDPAIFSDALSVVIEAENTGWIDQEQARRGSAKRSANRRWTRKPK